MLTPKTNSLKTTFYCTNNILALNEVGSVFISDEIGVTFEKITKTILFRLGVNINEDLGCCWICETRHHPNFSRGIIIGECKSIETIL
jgi:hypothetical protein